MQNIFNLFEYQKLEIIPGISSKRDNKVIKFDQDINLMSEHFKNYFRVKVSNYITTYDYREIREICSHIELDYRAGTENILNGIVKYLAESYISMIFHYTSCDNEADLKKLDRLRNLSMQEDLLKMIQMINSNKLYTDLDGTDSMYICNKTEIKSDLDQFTRSKYTHSSAYTCSVINKVMSIIGRDKTVKFSSYDEFFNLNDNCMNCYAYYGEKDKFVNIYAGKGCTEEDLTLALLLCQNFTNKTSWEANTKKIYLDHEKVLSYLKYRDLEHTTEYSTVEAKQEIKNMRKSNLFTSNANKVLINEKILDDDIKTEEDEVTEE
jgi:hypothetical protein